MRIKEKYLKIGTLVNFNNGYSNKKNTNKPASDVNFGAYKLIGKFKDPNYTWVDNFVYELSNKMKVIIVPKTGPDSISVNNNLMTGVINETDGLRGGKHCLEHLTVIDGSKDFKPGVMTKITESMGAQIGAHTGYDRTAYFFKVTNPSKEDFDTLIKLQANSIIYPKPSKKSFEKEKSVILEEIKQGSDSPYKEAFFSLIKGVFGLTDKHAGLGHAEDVLNMSRKAILDEHKRSYVPNISEMYIAGPVNHKEVIKVIDKYYDVPEFRPSTEPMHFEELKPIQSTKFSFIHHPRISTSYVTAGFAGPRNTDAKEIVAAKVFSEIFAKGRHSRLNKNTMSALNLDAGSALFTLSNNPSAQKMFLVEFSPTKPGNEQKILDVFRQSIDELKTKPITQEELSIAKNSLLNAFNVSAETSSEITSLLEEFSSSGGINAYENYVKDIESLTLKDVNVIAGKYLNPKKAAITILQPSHAQNTNISFSGKTLISPKSIKKYVLPNKVKLVINDTSDKIRTIANLKIESNVDAKPGTGLILTSLLDASTARHTAEEFALFKAKAGVDSVGVNNIPNGLSIIAATRKEFFTDAIKIINEIAFNPAINKENFDLAKAEIIQFVNSVRPTAKDRALETIYGHNHPEGLTIRYLGHVLDDVTFEDVQKYYNSLMKNPKVTATITGPIAQVEGLRAKIIQEFSQLSGSFANIKLNEPKVEPLMENKIIVQLNESLNQSDVAKFFHVDNSEIHDYAAMSVLNRILGTGISSRLFADLREKQQLCYYVGSKFFNCGTYAQEMLDIATGIKDGSGVVNNNLEKSLRGFSKHLDKLVKTLPKDSEVQRAQKSLINGFTSLFATASGTNTALIEGNTTKFGITFYNKLINEINKITPQDVQDVAKKNLTKPSVVSILTTEEALSKTKGYMETLGELTIHTKNDL